MKVLLIFALCIAATSSLAQGYRPPVEGVEISTTKANAAVLPPNSVVSVPMTNAEKEAMRLSVLRCWNIGNLDANALAMSVTVGFTMNPDAKPDVDSLQLLSYRDGSKAAADQAYDAARRAIIRCGSRGFDLPLGLYEQWRLIEMTFNSARMRIK